MSKILEKLIALKSLPTIPAVIAKLDKVLQHPECDTAMIAEVVNDDPTTAAGVLKLVNSVMFRPATGQEIGDIRVAITRIGVRSVKNVAMSAAIFEMFSGAEHPTFARARFWEHCIGVGAIASKLQDTGVVPNTRKIPADLIQLSGVLHDLGKIVLEEHLAAEFHSAIELAKKKQISLDVAEREVFEIDHTAVGAILGEKWRMPRELIEVVRYHHHPLRAETEVGRSLASLIHLADLIAHRKKVGASGNPVPTPDEDLMSELSVDLDDLIEQLDLSRLEPAH